MFLVKCNFYIVLDYLDSLCVCVCVREIGQCMSDDVLLVVLESEVLFHGVRFQNCVILQMCGAGDLIQTEHQGLQRLKLQ